MDLELFRDLDPEKPITVEQFINYISENENMHDEILRQMQEIRESINTRFSKFDNIQNQIALAQGSMSNDIKQIKSVSDNIIKFTDQIDKHKESLDKIDVAYQFIDTQMKGLAQLDLKTKQKGGWGVFKTIMTLLAIVGSIIVPLEFLKREVRSIIDTSVTIIQNKSSMRLDSLQNATKILEERLNDARNRNK